MKKLYLVLFITIATVYGQVTEKVFADVLSKAIYDADLYMDYIERKSIKEFKAIKEYKKTGLNTWAVKVQSYLFTDKEYSWDTWIRNIIIKNHGTHFEAYSESNPIISDFVERIVKHDDFPSDEDVIDGKDGLSYKRGWNDKNEAFTFSFKYVYPSDFDEGDLEDRIEHVVNFSRMFLSSLSKMAKEVKEEWLEEAEDNPIKEITVNKFLLLMADNSLIERYKKPEAYKGAIGYWSYTKSAVKISFDLILYPDKLDIFMTRKIGKNDSESDRKMFVEKLSEYLKEHPVDAATKSEVMFYPGYEEYFGIKSTFLFNGTIEGLALREMWNEIWDAYSEDLGDQITEIVGRE